MRRNHGRWRAADAAHTFDINIGIGTIWASAGTWPSPPGSTPRYGGPSTSAGSSETALGSRNTGGEEDSPQCVLPVPRDQRGAAGDCLRDGAGCAMMRARAEVQGRILPGSIDRNQPTLELTLTRSVSPNITSYPLHPRTRGGGDSRDDLRARGLACVASVCDVAASLFVDKGRTRLVTYPTDSAGSPHCPLYDLTPGAWPLCSHRRPFPAALKNVLERRMEWKLARGDRRCNSPSREDCREFCKR